MAQLNARSVEVEGFETPGHILEQDGNLLGLDTPDSSVDDNAGIDQFGLRSVFASFALPVSNDGILSRTLAFEQLEVANMTPRRPRRVVYSKLVWSSSSSGRGGLSVGCFNT